MLCQSYIGHDMAAIKKNGRCDVPYVHRHLLKLGGSVVEGDDLGGAHKREVQWVEEEHDVLPFVVRQLHLLEFAIHHSRSSEIWGWLLNNGLGRVGPHVEAGDGDCRCSPTSSGRCTNAAGETRCNRACQSVHHLKSTGEPATAEAGPNDVACPLTMHGLEALGALT